MLANATGALPFSLFSEPRCSCGFCDVGCQPRLEDVGETDILKYRYPFSHSQLQIARFLSMLCYGLAADRRFLGPSREPNFRLARVSLLFSWNRGLADLLTRDPETRIGVFDLCWFSSLPG